MWNEFSAVSMPWNLWRVLNRPWSMLSHSRRNFMILSSGKDREISWRPKQHRDFLWIVLHVFLQYQVVREFHFKPLWLVILSLFSLCCWNSQWRHNCQKISWKIFYNRLWGPIFHRVVSYHLPLVLCRLLGSLSTVPIKSKAFWAFSLENWLI